MRYIKRSKRFDENSGRIGKYSFSYICMKTVLYGIPPADAEMLRPQLSSLDAHFVEEGLTLSNVEPDAECVSVFVGSLVTREIIDALPHLKLISTRSVGFDHIDVEYAKSKGVSICTVPAYGTHTVAEFAFALILALSRNILPANERMRVSDSFDQSGLMGFDLFGKTLGVVGTGKIGKNVVRIGRGFGMNVVCNDLYPDTAFATEVGATYVDLPTLLSTSDVISLNAPYTKETHHLINQSNISSIKKGALLVNTARGELLETKALLTALHDGTVAAAGLDVLEGERRMGDIETVVLSEDAVSQESEDGLKLLLADEVLIHSGRVITTPHVAYFTKEAKAEILRVTAQNIVQFAAGTPQNIVGAH